MIYDLAIIGGGPAGAAAAVYASRKRLRTVHITKDWLGQSYVSDKIENWVGTPAISGLDLSKSLENHAKFYGKDYIDFRDGESCTDITKSNDHFSIKTDKAVYESKTILIASGSKRKKLDIQGADTYEHKGLTYCATCDGPMYSGQDVVVVGGGNAAFESAAQLLAYCKSVTLLNRSDTFRADPGTVEKVLSNPHMKAIKFAVPKQILGDKFVNAIIYTDTSLNKDITLSVSAIFAEIGSTPNTDFAKNIIELDPIGRIKINTRDQKTSNPNIWAAGDCTDALYHQNNIAAGDAVKALEDIYIHIKAK